MIYNSVWVSDLHLGTNISKAKELHNFLKENTFNNIFLVGDIIDMQQMKKKLFWKKSHNKVIQLLLKLSKTYNVYFIAGNHDEMLSIFDGDSFGSITVHERLSYTTLKGDKALILHGHQFDGIITKMKWLYWVGDNMYTLALFLNKVYNFITSLFGRNYWSLSQYLKSKVKNVVSFINNFENIVVEEAKKGGYDTVICGHIHVYADKNIDDIRYLQLWVLD